MAYGAYKYPALRKKSLAAKPERDWGGVLVRSFTYLGGSFFLAHAILFVLRLMGVLPR
jgi:hypothetical protein